MMAIACCPCSERSSRWGQSHDRSSTVEAVKGGANPKVKRTRRLSRKCVAVLSVQRQLVSAERRQGRGLRACFDGARRLCSSRRSGLVGHRVEPGAVG